MRLLVIAALCVTASVMAQQTGEETGVQSSQVQAFDQATALRFLYLSYAAYCPPANLMKWNCKFCGGGGTGGFNVTATVYDQKTNTFGYVGYHKSTNQVVVSFRGTVASSLKDWIDDLESIFKTDTPFDGISGAYTAFGFMNCYKALKNGTLAALRTTMQQHPGASVWFTGHSLGGALATLAILDFKLTNVASGSAYTFGSPRVGNPAFASGYNRYIPTTYRMTNHHDIVPHLPPEGFGFHHITQEVWENGSSYTQCSTSNGEDPKCADSVAVPDSIEDHLHYMGVAEGC